jgi:very-short-patch-repair endonuclease
MLGRHSHSNRALLATRARQMRFRLTPSEAALSKLIRGRKLGVTFRRQVVVVGQFIADFLAPSVRLVVEVDGGYHAGRTHADARRDEKLRRLGYKVLRIDARLVMAQPHLAVERVRAALARP